MHERNAALEILIILNTTWPSYRLLRERNTNSGHIWLTDWAFWHYKGISRPRGQSQGAAGFERLPITYRQLSSSFHCMAKKANYARCCCQSNSSKLSATWNRLPLKVLGRWCFWIIFSNLPACTALSVYYQDNLTADGIVVPARRHKWETFSGSDRITRWISIGED